MQAARQEGLARPQDWRRRNLMLRGLLASAGMLLVLAAWRLQLLPMPPLVALMWLALLMSPNLLFWPTRTLAPAQQRGLLTLELLLDVLLFLALIGNLGGAGNPVTFYLLVPLLIASLSLPLAHALVLLLIAFSGYGMSLHYGGHASHGHPLHDLSHGISDAHGLGMWLMFGVLGASISALGHALQQAQGRQARQQAIQLNLALQRERMYQVAADLADRAHEINTPLNALLLLVEDWSDSTATRTQQHVHQLAQRMADTLRQQHQRHPSAPQPLSHLCAMLEKQLRLLSPGLRVRFEGESDPLLTAADDWQRILNNLGYNACDAGASELVIRTASAPPSPLLIQVSDDGPRHPSQQSEQHQGLGIGLALVESTLASLGGTLELVFDNRWTSAIIRLPQGPADAH